MVHIPITFEFEGKEYKGHLVKILGAGDNVWQLMVDNHYWGALELLKDKWVFHSPTREMKDLAEFFGEWIIRFSG